MKAAYITEPGPPHIIHYGDLPAPTPAAGQCLIKVSAVSVNPIDTYIRGGLVPAELPSPFIVGCDFSGSVAALGAGVTKFRAGDHVWGSNQGLLGRQGTFAEFIVVDEQWIYPKPGSVSHEAATATALVGITAHLGLVRDAQLRANDILFVNGGTGGVGSMVVQMAKTLGAKVVTTGGTDEKVAQCRELGADLAINYQTDDVAEAVKSFAPEGVNVWWETLREPDFERTVPLLARRGRMILMASREAKPAFPVGPFYVKDCSLHGFAMFNAGPEEQNAAATDINRWLVEGSLKPRIDRTLPLSETAAAHQLQEESTIHKSGALAGKIVLRLEQK